MKKEMRRRYAVPEVRPLKFELPLDLPKDFFHGDQALSDLFHGLSLFFPDGERFFIESVKPYVDQLGPELRTRVDAFMKQEAYHSREHERYNRLLQSWGYPAKHIEKILKEDLDRERERMSPIQKLAVTCALEHFTAVLADGLLSAEEVFDKADPVLGALWRWHAVEELEHKAVAFDVFQEVGGGTLQRNWSMFLTTVGFLYGIFMVVNAMFDTDQIPRRKGWARIGRFLFHEKKIGQRVLRNYFAYYRPGFHPWDQDNIHFIERWNSAFPALREKLGWA
jgi:uncharacterized protein